MELIKPYAKIEDEFDGQEMVKRIERAGRTCYKSEDRITEGSAEAFCKMILKRGHETVIEHEKVTVRFVCDRGVTHEIVRHRVASYSQESTRYVNYGNKDHIQFVIPCWCPDLIPGVLVIPRYTNEITTDQATVSWLHAISFAEDSYQQLILQGWRPEQARSVLPNSLKTEIVMTANLREWRHFFKLRTSAAAHPQMREVASMLLNEFQKRIPWIFDDLSPEIA
jgi:thymidylate synthase (FAD)